MKHKVINWGNIHMDKVGLADYVEKLQLGDISAFEVIYNETNNQVYNLLYSYTKIKKQVLI